MSGPLAGGRIGPIGLAAGITRRNAWALLVVMFFLGILAPYINIAQPYILTEHLGIPKARQGAVSGNLAFWTEIVLIALSGLLGAWSDRVGRRLVFTLGILAVAASYALYPLATSYGELLAFRLVYAAGMAAIGVMSVAVQSGYPAEQSRGKFIGLIAVLSILGVLVALGALAPLPALFTRRGATAIEAGRLAYWIAAAIALAGAVVAWAGLSRRGPANATRRSFTARVRDGLVAAQGNPRIALAYAAAFVARTDLVVIFVFLSLWITHAAVARGLSTAEAQLQAGIMLAVVQGSALLFSPLMGLITDRLNRVAALAIGTGLALTGYVWIGLLDEPMGPVAWPAAVVLGMGQVAAILSATALVGQEADDASLGSVSGFFTLSGAVGILLATKTGGLIYDAWMPGGPFLVTGLLNLLVMLAALLTMATGRHRPAARPAAADPAGQSLPLPPAAASSPSRSRM